MINPKQYKKLKEVIYKANPEIIQEFEENESITEQIGSFVRQSTQLTGRKYIYEREIRLADVVLVIKKNVYTVEELAKVENDELKKNYNKLKNNCMSILLAWYLLDDNLDNQSDPTKQLLIDLLI